MRNLQENPTTQDEEATDTESRQFLIEPDDQKTLVTLLGEMVWLLTQSPRHQSFFLSDLAWLVTAPIMLKQFRVFYTSERPIGFALWAYVNELVEERLIAGNARLAPADWKSGKTLWLVEVVAPFGGRDEMIIDLKRTVFPEMPMQVLTLREGGTDVQTL